MNRGSETNNSDVSAIVNNENGERDSGTAKGAPIIRQVLSIRLKKLAKCMILVKPEASTIGDCAKSQL